MKHLSVEWNKFENLVNRALIIIAHLHNIVGDYQELIRNSKETGTRKRQGYDRIVNTGTQSFFKFFSRKKTIIVEAHKWTQMFYLFDALYLDLKSHYSNLKGLVIAMEEVIKIDEHIKKQGDEKYSLIIRSPYGSNK